MNKEHIHASYFYIYSVSGIFLLSHLEDTEGYTMGEHLHSSHLNNILF